MLRDDESARDAVQQTFIVMIEKIGTLRHDITFRQWLFTIARNESLMILRRKRLVPMDGIEGAGEEIFDDATPETVYTRIERSALLHQALDQMKPAYRELILLRLTEELTYEEIAGITNTTVSSVRSKLNKARIALAKIIAPCLSREDLQ
jgi:RNA polymerase sigma-70 factor (ECF subfamily)